MDRIDRTDIEGMIDRAIENYEKLQTLKLDLILEMLKTNQGDVDILKEKVKNTELRDATKELSCPYKKRIEILEKLALKMILLTSFATSILMYILPIIFGAIKDLLF